MTHYTEKQFASLPKWAQHELKDLQHEVDKLEAEQRAVLGEEMTEVSMKHGQTTKVHTQYLSPHYGIDFKLSGMASLNVRLEDDGLRISGTGFPTQLVVTPHVTNVIHVGVI